MCAPLGQREIESLIEEITNAKLYYRKRLDREMSMVLLPSRNRKIGRKKHLIRLQAPHQEPFGPDDSLFALTEKDFEEVSPKLVSEKVESRTATMNVQLQAPVETKKAYEAPNDAIRELLPSAIAKKVSRIVPEGFEVSEITLTGEISGKPFGVGFSGQVSVTYAKSKSE